MPLIREFAALVARTGALWVRHLLPLCTWLVAGWLVLNAGLMASAVLGGEHRLLALLCFVLGISGQVIGTVFAVLSLKPGLRTALEIQRRGIVAPADVPAEVLSREPYVEVALLVIGPLLGVYSVWGQVDSMIRQGFVWNTLVRSWDSESWSVSFSLDQFPIYLGIAVAALLLRLVWGRLFTNRRNPWVRVPMLFFEGAWVFATFFVAFQGLRELQAWVRQREFWRNGEVQWHEFVNMLPDIKVWFDLTLPQAVRNAWAWLWESFLPGAWQGVALPLVWLAVVGMIYGWRDLRAANLFSGRVRQRAEGIEFTSRLGRAGQSAFNVVTDDLRDKYLPILHALRLIWRSGPYVLGAYLVLFNVLTLAEFNFVALFNATFSSATQDDMLRNLNTVSLLRVLVFSPLFLCLYAATFDRGLRDAAGLNRTADHPLPMAVSPRS